MTASSDEFSSKFAVLLEALNDPDALFWGEGMLSDLLALEALAQTDAHKALLFREVSVLQGKRYEPDCLDYADRALEAQEKSTALSDDRLYYMHVLCGDYAAAWGPNDKAMYHLEKAFALNSALEKPIDEGFAIRLNLGVVTRTEDSPTAALAIFEPLLTDAEQHYGSDNGELAHLIGLIASSKSQLKQYNEAITFQTRAAELTLGAGDDGRYVSALTTLARFNARAGHHSRAKSGFRSAITHAKLHCSPATIGFAEDTFKEEYSRLGLYIGSRDDI